ncbi:MAG: CopG family antitoxin [Candidatus Margulisbacteria bacterium]|nr:CopG family antitoxin [Candidatus Margulisiibacteriota bacterium]
MAEKTYLDKYEKELDQSVERGEWVSAKNKGKLKKKLFEAVHDNLKQKKSISIRLPEKDIREIKKKSMETGIPYQNLIQSLVHKFVTGEIKLGV